MFWVKIKTGTGNINCKTVWILISSNFLRIHVFAWPTVILLLDIGVQSWKIWNDPQKTLKKNASGKKLHLLKTNKTTGNSLVPKYIILMQIHDHNVGTLNYPRHPYIFKAPLKLIQPSSYTILDENAHINSGQSTTFSINPVICNRERCIEYWACVSSGICLPIVRCCSVSVSN